MIQSLIGVLPVHHFRAAVFEIDTDIGPVYMHQERQNYNSESTAVVEVDAQKFLNLWRLPDSYLQEIALGNPSTWVQDRKFNDAMDGFSKGLSNPVPLAECKCFLVEKKTEIWERKMLVFKKVVAINIDHHPALSFINGVTRTIWLLSHGAKSFPVNCSIHYAPLLQELAGLEGSHYMSIDSLVPVRNRNQEAA